LIATITAFVYLNPNYSRIISPRSQRLWLEFTQSLFPLDFSQLILLGKPAIETVNMSILAILIAAIGGAMIAIPATTTLFQPGGVLNAYSRQSVIWYRLTSVMARYVLLVARSIPAPIWALVALYILFPGILPGAIALGIHNLGVLGRLFTAVIENLDRRPLEALKSTGATTGGIYWYGILPNTITQKLAYTCYRWEICMRETVIVGLVGAGGLGRLLTEQLTSFDYRSLMVTLTVFLLLTFGVDCISQRLRQQLKKPNRYVNTGNNQL
jgi:phosphonate transport system permease protein